MSDGELATDKMNAARQTRAAQGDRAREFFLEERPIARITLGNLLLLFLLRYELARVAVVLFGHDVTSFRGGLDRGGPHGRNGMGARGVPERERAQLPRDTVEGACLRSFGNEKSLHEAG